MKSYPNWIGGPRYPDCGNCISFWKQRVWHLSSIRCHLYLRLKNGNAVGVTSNNVTIINTDLSDLVLELFSEPETRKIISALLENEYTIPQILKESKVPKTSGYRKIENLIINGLVIESGKVLSESKRISKLQCVFQEIKLDIKKEKITVKGVISKKMFEKSTSMKSIFEAQD